MYTTPQHTPSKSCHSVCRVGLFIPSFVTGDVMSSSYKRINDWYAMFGSPGPDIVSLVLSQHKLPDGSRHKPLIFHSTDNDVPPHSSQADDKALRPRGHLV
ncbi:hypothetical protein AcV5_002853 [Taiwanofungus camphoratus]|nr:hypothetical protein AcV5_002853 [Antrodia cinnamomea]KAI0925121.1 hypothetical protein AcW2_005803 [Antrodia cinnamomea]KAI0929667.1 hypothetical protein AcV7_005145 [Antrodia cinnamomea]